MKKKVLIVTVVIISITAGFLLFLTEQSYFYYREYFTEGELLYKNITYAQALMACYEFGNISMSSNPDFCDSDLSQTVFFRCYAYDKNGKVNKDYELDGSFYYDHGKDELGIIFEMHEEKNKKEDFEIVKENGKFIESVLYPILGEPYENSSHTLIIG